MSTETVVDLERASSVAIQLVIAAGEALLRHARERTELGHAKIEVQQKLNAVDLVTEADEAAEDLIKAGLKEAFPDHAFVGEESYGKGAPRDEYMVGDGPTWVVDPLDGTVNFVHLFPTACVSIALCLQGKPIVGVVYAPFFGASFDGGSQPSGHLYTAVSGKGAYVSYDAGRTRRRLPLISPPPVIPAQAPKGCTLAVEWGKDRRDVGGGNLERKVNSFWNLAGEVGGRNGKGGMVHGVRSLGSAVLDLVFVATGAIDIFWEGGCWEWDVAAGICLVNESGGLVVDSNPPQGLDTPIKPAHLGGRRYLAVRACSGSESETALQAQERLIREVWKRVEGVNYARPGVAYD